jgi:hypothetical protein
MNYTKSLQPLLCKPASTNIKHQLDLTVQLNNIEELRKACSSLEGTNLATETSNK